MIIKCQLANTKIDEIRNGFSEWLEAQSPEFKEKLVDLYNDKFNCEDSKSKCKTLS